MEWDALTSGQQRQVEADRAGFLPQLERVGVDSAEMLQPVIAEQSHTFHLEHCEAGGTMAFGDPDKVRQIAINLITNALKYSPPGTEIVLRCGRSGTDVFAEVQDAGPGIEPAKREAIFQPFVQLEGGIANRQGGIGLGLTIARRLSRAMRGQLTIDGPPEGGSVFRLTLPTGGRKRLEGGGPE